MIRNLSFVLIIISGLACSTSSTDGGSQNILIIGDSVTETSLDSIFTGEGVSFTVIPSDSGYYGWNPLPTGYSAVILCDGEGYDYGMPVDGQRALVQYVNGGGRLVILEWVAYEVESDRYDTLAPLLPMVRTSGSEGSEEYTVVANGPLTEGVDSSFTVATGTNVGTARYGTVWVHGSICGDAVVSYNVGAGSIIQFASAGNYEGYKPFLEPNMKKMLLNAIR